MPRTLERPVACESFVARNIHCTACADTLERTLATLPGVVQIHVDPMIGWTHIDFDPDQVSADEILGAVEERGYEIVRTWD